MHIIASSPLHTYKGEGEEEREGGEKKSHKISLKRSPLRGPQVGTSHRSWVSDCLIPELPRNTLMGWLSEESTCTLLPHVHLLKSMHSPQFLNKNKDINVMTVECTLKNVSILRRYINQNRWGGDERNQVNNF